MCTTCGCGTSKIRIESGDPFWQTHKDGNAQRGTPQTDMKRNSARYRQVLQPQQHIHHITRSHHHLHRDIPAEHQHAPGLTQARMIKIERDILAKNDHYAKQNRSAFEARGILTLNLVSSPGAGKTALLVSSINKLKQKIPLAVIEGDQQTSNDAERIRETGAPAIQINTGKGCHLDAHMVGKALTKLTLSEESLLFIENVGNLVCPANFDLGEAHKVIIFAVTEGEDKPLKYPDMFRAADIMLLNKCDLLPYLNFDVERAIKNARLVNPHIEIIHTSATTGEGITEWLNWIAQKHKIASTEYDKHTKKT